MPMHGRTRRAWLGYVAGRVGTKLPCTVDVSRQCKPIYLLDGRATRAHVSCVSTTHLATCLGSAQARSKGRDIAGQP